MTTPRDCELCQTDEYQLCVETRKTKGGIRRRRVCRHCGTAWTTLEIRSHSGQPMITLPLPLARQFRALSSELLCALDVVLPRPDAPQEPEP